MNLITLALVLVPLEAALRWLSKQTPDAPVFAGTVLLPRSWDKAVTHYRRVADQPDFRAPFVHRVRRSARMDSRERDRRSGNGLHMSSAEGLRSATTGAVLAGATNKKRIAIWGDSMAFAQGVRFEDSWGYLLQKALGTDIEVLNFGVPGYGVDQAYLKFKTEVLTWQPDAVVLGFPEHNLFRTMTVYPFINWTDGIGPSRSHDWC